MGASFRAICRLAAFTYSILATANEISTLSFVISVSIHRNTGNTFAIYDALFDESQPRFAIVQPGRVAVSAGFIQQNPQAVDWITARQIISAKVIRIISRSALHNIVRCLIDIVTGKIVQRATRLLGGRTLAQSTGSVQVVAATIEQNSNGLIPGGTLCRGER
jgi:hypothetical protein